MIQILQPHPEITHLCGVVFKLGETALKSAVIYLLVCSECFSRFVHLHVARFQIRQDLTDVVSDVLAPQDALFEIK